MISPKISTCSCGLAEKLSSSSSLHIAEPFDMLDSAVITMLDMPRNSVRDFVNVGARHPLTTRHECWAVAEQFIHIFEV